MASFDVVSLAHLIQALPEPTLLCDRDKAVVAANRASLTLLSSLRSDPSSPWQLGDLSVDALLHRVLRGQAQVTDDLSDGQRQWRVTARRIDHEDATLVVVQLREDGPRSGGRSHVPRPVRDSLLARALPGIAHELRGPLTTISGVAQLASVRQADGDDAGSYASLVQEQVKRSDALLRSASSFARGPQLDEELPVAMADVLERALELLAYELRSRSVEVGYDLDSDLPRVTADPEDVLAIVLSLLLGLVDETDGVTRIHLTAERDRGRLRLAIEADASNLTPAARLGAAGDVARDLGGSLRLEPNGEGALTGVLELPGYVEDERLFLRPPTVLLADRNLDRLVRSHGELAGVAGRLHLASTARVAERCLSQRLPRAALVELSLARQIDKPLPRPSVISAPPGREDEAQALASELAVGWEPHSSAVARLREELLGEKRTPTQPGAGVARARSGQPARRPQQR